MRLHTKLGGLQLSQALRQAKDKGHVGGSVVFAVDSEHASRTHKRAFEIQLGAGNKGLPEGTVDQRGHTMRFRRVRNNNNFNERNRYAATWHEWGWFMREVFEMDPDARWGPEKGWGYRNLADFNSKTDYQFVSEAQTA
jgi:hypothetical protein